MTDPVTLTLSRALALPLLELIELDPDALTTEGASPEEVEQLTEDLQRQLDTE